LFRLSNCKLHGFDPQAYFADVLNKLVNLWPASRLDELMPWAYEAATHRIALQKTKPSEPSGQKTAHRSSA
jgi:IS66 C-terminal element